MMQGGPGAVTCPELPPAAEAGELFLEQAERRTIETVIIPNVNTNVRFIMAFHHSGMRLQNYEIKTNSVF